MEPRAGSARHWIFQSLDYVQRESATARLTCVWAIRCLAAQTFEVVADSAAGAGRDWWRTNAHRCARFMALVFDFGGANCGHRPALAHAACDRRVRFAFGNRGVFYPSSKT